MRTQGELMFNDPNTKDFNCYSAFTELYCLFLLKICLIFMGALWFSIIALFLQYGLRSSQLKKQMGAVLAISTWVGIRAVVSKIRINGEPEKCPESINEWTFRALSNAGIFFTLYSASMSYDEINRFGINLKLVTSLFLKLFIPFNLFGYIDGILIFSEIRQKTPDCVSNPYYLCLELTLYEWVIFSPLLAMVGCAVGLRYHLLTIDQVRINPFLTLVELSEEEALVEDTDLIRFNENYAACLRVTSIDSTKHRTSFFEKAVCPICWEPYTREGKVVYFPGCEHVFHEECIKTWVRAHTTCPTCRRSLPLAAEMTDMSHYTQL